MVSEVPALRLYVVALTASGAETLRADSAVATVDLDKVREVQSGPNDPQYGDQWALGKIGWDSAFSSLVPTGSATVAVLDTGIDRTDDLAQAMVPGASMLDTSDTSDANGHGTAMASIVAAGTDNNVGIAGVGYHGVSVMPVKVLGPDGTGQDSDVVEGVVYAADRGVDVILMSFSNPGRSAALQVAADYAWSKGTVLVAATGNDGSTVTTYPAGLAKVAGVSATDRDDTLWSGSNSGADTFLAAPGVAIASGSGVITGTSASAAIAAGAAALVKANDPSASNSVVVGRLARTADTAGSASDTGNGRVDVARALADTSSDPVVPQGVNEDGGPFVGPYRAAGQYKMTLNVKDRKTNLGIPGVAVSCTTGCTASGTTNSSGVWGEVTLSWSGNANQPIVLALSKSGYHSTTVSGTLTHNGSATWTVHLDPNTAAPVAQSQSVSTPVGTAKVVTLSSSDVDGDFQNFSIVTGPAHGTLTKLGALGTIGCTGTTTKTCTIDVRYTPTAGYSGSDSFTFRTRDGDLDSNTATVSITVASPNRAPSATNDSYATNEDSALTVSTPGVIGNDTDADGNAITASKLTNPSHGSVTLNSNGSFTYTPNANFSGADSFTYKASDGTLDSAAATVSLTVNPVNDAPRRSRCDRDHAGGRRTHVYRRRLRVH